MIEPIQILIADDHPIVRQGLCAVLVARNGMKVVGEASDGDEAVTMARDLRPDVILMDLIMPKTSGVEATARILQDNPEARVLILTSFGSDEHIGQALRTGAMGLLPKESQPDDLLHAIRSVHRGQLTIPQHAVRALTMPGMLSPASEPPLTEREEDVLNALARGLSNQQTADQLGIGANTVRTHVSNLLRKLALSNRTELAIYALKREPRQ